MIDSEIDKPEISVIMSVFNGEEFLREAIESVLNQTYKNFEFIIINDCSTDKTGDIIKEFELRDKRIVLIEKTINKGFKGFVENLNIGLSKAKGKFIARMDADDICLPERLEKQLSYLKKNPEVFLLGTSITLIDRLTNKIGEMNAFVRVEDIEKRMRIDNPISHPTIMFRNENGMRYREKLHTCEDFDFHLRILSDRKVITNLSEPLLQYRILETSISRKGNTLIKRLFLEQAKYFYLQRLKYGYDDYEEFDDNQFLNIFDESFINDKKYLVFGCSVAILYGKVEELDFIYSKLQNEYAYKNLYFQLNLNKNINRIVSFLMLKLRKYNGNIYKIF